MLGTKYLDFKFGLPYLPTYQRMKPASSTLINDWLHSSKCKDKTTPVKCTSMACQGIDIMTCTYLSCCTFSTVHCNIDLLKFISQILLNVPLSASRRSCQYDILWRYTVSLLCSTITIFLVLDNGF